MLAILISSLMAFGRMSYDNEITAIRTSGVSFIQVLLPALSFGILVTIIMVFFISPPFGNYLSLPNTISINGSFTLDPRPGLLKTGPKTFPLFL